MNADNVIPYGAGLLAVLIISVKWGLDTVAWIAGAVVMIFVVGWLIDRRRIAAPRFGGHSFDHRTTFNHENRHVDVMDGLKIKHHAPEVWHAGGGYWYGRVLIRDNKKNMKHWHSLSGVQQAAVYAAGALGPEGNEGCNSDLTEVRKRASVSAAKREARRHL